MKKLLVLAAFLGFGYVAVQAQTVAPASVAQQPKAVSNKPAEAKATVNIAEAPAAATIETKKECSTAEKKSCSSASGKKSCCSSKKSAAPAKTPAQ